MYLTDGYINLAIVCWKRTKETLNPYPDGYGLDHFGVHVDDLARARRRKPQAGAVSQPPPPVDPRSSPASHSERSSRCRRKFDLSGHGWATKPEKK